MSPITQWGPACWNLFHTLAEKIKEESFPLIGQQMYSQIYLFCQNLPCKDCSDHAKLFLSKVNINDLKTKIDLKNLLFVMHEAVNNRKNAQSFKYENLELYKNYNLINTYKKFAATYHTDGNLQLIAENYYRKQLIIGFKSWLKQNINHFILD